MSQRGYQYVDYGDDSFAIRIDTLMRQIASPNEVASTTNG
jgi:hypothetical protein